MGRTRGYPSKKERKEYLNQMFKLREIIREKEKELEILRENDRFRKHELIGIIKEGAVEAKRMILDGEIDELMLELQEIIEGEPDECC